jgi:hypothetical protein
MKLIPAVIAACLYGSLGSALAVQTFDLVLSGEAHNVPSGGAAAGLLYGAAQVKLADGGDGNYVGGNLISIDLWANFSGVIPGMFGSAFHFSTTGTRSMPLVSSPAQRSQEVNLQTSERLGTTSRQVC